MTPIRGAACTSAPLRALSSRLQEEKGPLFHFVLFCFSMSRACSVPSEFLVLTHWPGSGRGRPRSGRGGVQRCTTLMASWASGLTRGENHG